MRGGLYMYRFQVNGTQHEVQEDQRLIDFLRSDLKLTGTKEGCSAGACGTCTVIIDGKKAKACVTKLSQLDGKSVVTIEGLSEREKAVYTYAFGECGAVQCGFCIPGMIISAKVLIDENNDPTPDDVKKDKEGLQTMRTLGQNMAWLLKCIELGKNNDINKPEYEPITFTSFPDGK